MNIPLFRFVVLGWLCNYCLMSRTTYKLAACPNGVGNTYLTLNTIIQLIV